jgi:uncharacterized OB-fold protein
MTEIAFAPDVFTWPSDEPQLIGGRCGQCSAVTFPAWPSCARCGSTEVEEPYASGETNETFTPYGIGMVQLGDEVRVEGRLTESDPAKLEIGMELELVIIPFRTDDDGTVVMTYAFAPVAAQEA